MKATSIEILFFAKSNLHLDELVVLYGGSLKIPDSEFQPNFLNLSFIKKFIGSDKLFIFSLCSFLTLNALTNKDNGLIGGSADLAGSNNTKTKKHKIIEPGKFDGNYIHYGVREHAMSGIMNGIALHSNFIPYGGTFLIFSDYCKPSIRLSALMQQRVIYVMTHDSIGLGEDGPTHQPIEQLSGLRSIPNLNIFRPADRVETIECWAHALKSTKTPSIFLVLFPLLKVHFFRFHQM